MTPAREKAHEPTAVKREMTEKIWTSKSVLHVYFEWDRK
jgi:hypothetical protein